MKNTCKMHVKDLVMVCVINYVCCNLPVIEYVMHVMIDVMTCNERCIGACNKIRMSCNNMKNYMILHDELYDIT